MRYFQSESVLYRSKDNKSFAIPKFNACVIMSIKPNGLLIGVSRTVNLFYERNTKDKITCTLKQDTLVNNSDTFYIDEISRKKKQYSTF